MKRKLSLSLAALTLVLALATPAYAQDTVNIVVNGTALELSSQPIVENGRTLVPFRDVLEAMGAEVLWDGETKTITCTLADKNAELVIGSDYMKSGSTMLALDVPAQIVNSRTYVPLRAISEGLGADVMWDSDTKTVTVSTLKANKTTSDYTNREYSNPIKSGSRVIMPVSTTYPVFKGNGRAVAKVNKYIKDDAEGRVNAYKISNTKRLYSLYQDCIRQGTRSMFDNYSYNVTYEVKTNENDIISLYVTETITSDNENRVTISGVTLNSKTGNVITANELYENAAQVAKDGFIANGFDKSLVAYAKFDDTSFYVENGKLIYIINKGVLSNKLETYSISLPAKPIDATPLAIYADEKKLSDTLYSHTDGIVITLNTEYPQFASSSKNLTALNEVIEKTQKSAMDNFKETNRADALAAFKAFEDTKNKKSDRFEPWVWTSDYEVKYSDDNIASIVTSTYVYKGDNSEATTYTAYTCNLKTGKLVDVNTLINDKAKTDSAARAAFKALIERDRLNFYTDVYDVFDLSKAVKYISGDGVTYMFNPGELASVSKGVIEVTVPMS